MTNIQKDNECNVNQFIKQNQLKSELYLQQPGRIMIEQVQSQITNQQTKLNEQGVQTMQILESSSHYNDEVHKQTLLLWERQNQEQKQQNSQLSRIKIDLLDLAQINQDYQKLSNLMPDNAQNKKTESAIMIKQRDQEGTGQNEQDNRDREQNEEYERIIDKLNKKLTELKLQYDALMGIKRQQDEQITTKYPFQLINYSPITCSNLTINKVYSYQTKLNKNIEQQHSHDTQQQSNSNNQIEQKQSQIIHHYIHHTNTKSNHQRITNNHNQTANSPRQQQAPNTQKLTLNSYHGVSSQPFQTVVNQQVERQTYSVGILSRSLENLTTLKQSIDTLSYERINHLMSVQWLSKISFKQKHYPSQSSTPQQLKLYAKRLLKLLINPVEQISPNPMTNYIGGSLYKTYSQNDIEYDQTEQYVAFMSKQINSLIIICYYNKTIYIGPFDISNSINSPIRQGHAIQIRQNKYVYQGQFHANKKHGYGFIHFINKNPKIYAGYWMDGFIDGTGKQIYHTGQTYEGDFKLGLRDGIGQIYYQNDKIHCYKGQFYDGFKHGNGFQKFPNGDTYTGSYIKDKFHAQGQYTWKNGTIYKGSFHLGQKHGQGLLLFTNGQQSLKYYDHNIQVNIQNQTIRTSAASNITLNKIHEKYSLIQDKPNSSKNYKSESSKTLSSAKSLCKNISIKQIKSKKTIAELIKHKQLEQDLKNLNTLLKPTPSQSSNKIFSIKKLSQTQNVMGKMYNINNRPTIKINEHIGIDMLGLGRTGSQRKSLISFDGSQRLQEGKESTYMSLGII